MSKYVLKYVLKGTILKRKRKNPRSKLGVVKGHNERPDKSLTKVSKEAQKGKL